MLSLVLASLLVAHPAGEGWSVSLHPAIDVEGPGAPEASSLDLPEASEGRTLPAQDGPRLAPARTVSPKASRRSVARTPRKRR